MVTVPVYGLRGLAASNDLSGYSAGNPLVVGPIDTATPFSGTRLLDDGAQLVSAIENRDWLSGSLAVVSGVMDAVSFALNPIAGLVSMGVGWVLDHIEPLKTWLNQLTGDAGAVSGGAATWENIAQALGTAGTALTRSLEITLADVRSEAVEAYKRLMSDVSSHMELARKLASAIKTGLTAASTIVQVVHDLVRDAISEVVGVAVSCIIPLPNVIADLSAKVAKWVTRIGEKLKELTRSFDRLRNMYNQADGLVGRLRDVFEKVGNGMRQFSQAKDELGQWLGKQLGGTYDPTRIYSMVDGSSHSTTFAPEQLPESRISNDFLASHGIDRDGLINLINTPVDSLSPAELSLLKEVRDAVPAPASGTVMQKVLGQPYFDAQGNLVLGGGDLYVLGNQPNFDPTRVQGSVSVAADTAHLGTPAELFEGLRLDYAGTHFTPGDTSVQVLRFEAEFPDRISTSYGSAFGGTGPQANWTPPFTGNGFTGTNGSVIPEYLADAVPLKSGAEIWEVTNSGNQRLLAVLRGKTWIPEGN